MISLYHIYHCTPEYNVTISFLKSTFYSLWLFKIHMDPSCLMADFQFVLCLRSFLVLCFLCLFAYMDLWLTSLTAYFQPPLPNPSLSHTYLILCEVQGIVERLTHTRDILL